MKESSSCWIFSREPGELETGEMKAVKALLSCRRKALIFRVSKACSY